VETGVKRHTYTQAERFILSRELFGMKLGLENIRQFLADIGSPQLKFATVHVGGTNGKGSSSAMLASVLCAPPRRFSGTDQDR
jgi:dihydrofolate synthase/folylpolyglutamate synthase